MRRGSAMGHTVWIAAEAFVGPGIQIGATLGASLHFSRSSTLDRLCGQSRTSRENAKSEV
jgi:hypothetical protein